MKQPNEPKRYEPLTLETWEQQDPSEYRAAQKMVQLGVYESLDAFLAEVNLALKQRWLATNEKQSPAKSTTVAPPVR